MFFELSATPVTPPAIVRAATESDFVNSARQDLPNPQKCVLPGVPWGRPDVLFTPAYWKTQMSYHPHLLNSGANRLGTSFKEEVVACLLGGHGLPAEVGVAAFAALRNSGLIEKALPSAEEIFGVLSRPITLGSGRTVHYRFPRTKSRSISSFLAGATRPSGSLSHRAIRDWLTSFSGIGPKTGSWIVRNWFDSDEVAILDIHIHRAGLLMGLFSDTDLISKHYRQMENRYLAFCEKLSVRAAAMDALMWIQMRTAGRLALKSPQLYDPHA